MTIVLWSSRCKITHLLFRQVEEKTMSRRIISKALQAASGPSGIDTYSDRVVKYIPADVVAAWVTASGLIKAAENGPYRPSNTVLWVIFAVGLFLAGAWTWKQTNRAGMPPPVVQIVISTIAFAVWVFGLGGPFPQWVGLYNPVTNSLALIAYTLAVGLVAP
jgi:hypothetical protein